MQFLRNFVYLHVLLLQLESHYAISNRMYGDFTMETILAAAFGCEANVQRGEGNEVTHAAKMVFGSTANPKLLPLSIMNLIFILGM